MSLSDSGGGSPGTRVRAAAERLPVGVQGSRAAGSSQRGPTEAGSLGVRGVVGGTSVYTCCRATPGGGVTAAAGRSRKRARREGQGAIFQRVEPQQR